MFLCLFYLCLTISSASPCLKHLSQNHHQRPNLQTYHTFSPANGDQGGDIKGHWTDRVQDGHAHNCKYCEEHEPSIYHLWRLSFYCTSKSQKIKSEDLLWFMYNHLMIMICLRVVLVKKFQSPSNVVLARTWDTWDSSIIQSCSGIRLVGWVDCWYPEKLTDSKTPKRRVVVITLAASSQTRERTARTEVIRIAYTLEVRRWGQHFCAFQEINLNGARTLNHIGPH